MSDGNNLPLQDIELGDKVKSSDGHTITDQTVLAKYDSGVKECLKLTFKDGNTLTASREHKIRTPKGFTRAEDLLLGDIVYTELCSDFTPSQHVSLDDAFLLGLWVAEGTKRLRTQFAYSNQTPEILAKADTICSSRGWKYSYISILIL
jgi:hypothetical protein